MPSHPPPHRRLTSTTQAPYRVSGALLLCLVVLAGCSSTSKPDFSFLYRERAGVARRPPLIVIPGVMGSRLVRSDGHEVWPGGVAALLTGRSFRALALQPGEAAATDSPLVPRGFFDALGGRSFYRDLVRALEEYGHYRCRPPEEIDASTDCVLLAWDWRQDFVAAARQVERVVEHLREARLDPSLRVDVVAHSAGGLVARYFVRYGGRDVLGTDELPVPDPAGHGVDRLILIGTPSFGSITAVQQAMFGKSFPLGHVEPDVLASFPGLPELFPHPQLDWMIEPDGLPSDLNLFSIETWRAHRVGIFSPRSGDSRAERIRSGNDRVERRRTLETAFGHALARGERFQRALAFPQERSDVSYFVFGSGCTATPARCLVEHDGGRLALRGRPEEIRHPLPGVDYRARMLEPGDGSVTKSSLLGLPSLVDGRTGAPVFPVTATVFICAPHESLSSNPTFIDNLLHVLLYRGPASASHHGTPTSTTRSEAPPTGVAFGSRLRLPAHRPRRG